MTTTGEKLQVLIVEDRPADAELMAKQLIRGGFDIDWQRVETERDFKLRLTPRLDLILTDYSLPAFGALPALKALAESNLDIPILVVTGTLGDEKAAECLKLGATDYVLKDRMARLGAAVRGALEAHRARVQAKRMEEALIRSEERFRAILGTLEDVVWSLSLKDGNVTYMNPAGEKMFGRPVEQFYANRQLWVDAVHPEDRPRMLALQQSMIRWGTGEGTMRVVRPDGAVRIVNTRAWCAYGSDGAPARLEGICTDITEKRAREQQVEREHVAMEEAQAIAHLGSWEWDPIADRAMLSKEGWRIWDVEPSKVAGSQTFIERVHPDDRPGFQQLIEACAKNGADYEVIVRIRTSGGERWTRHRGHVSVRDKDGRPVRMGGTIEDVTEAKRAERQREQLTAARQEAQRLQQLNEFRSQFIRTMAHELNTPVTPMKIQLYLLKADNFDSLTDAQKQAVTILSRNVERLSEFLQDLLDSARLQAGELKLNVASTDLGTMLRGAVQGAEAQARAVGLRITAAVKSPLVAEADPRRIEQVATNLLSNAIKFSPPGGTISVDAKEDRGNVVVTVTDTGRGLQADDIPRLFQPFSQLQGATQEKHTGTGLGLFICKGIVERHGGRIWCQSPGPGQGSTFAFSLPTKPVAKAARSDKPQAASGLSPTP